MFHVTFKFEHSDDISIYAAHGENLLQVARKANVAIDAPCSGNGSCGKCRVKLLSGQVNSPAPADGLRVFYYLMKKLGCTEEELDLMIRKNPAKLLDLD